MAEQYISAYSGIQIDEAIGSYLANKNYVRTIIKVEVAAGSWQTTGSTPLYSKTINLQGTYKVGEYPIVYFIDTNNAKYELDTVFTLDNGGKPTQVTVYSNANIGGWIIEVASLSEYQKQS